MANYSVRADGTAANKAAALDGDKTVASECMNVSVHNGETFSAGDNINIWSNGGVYRSQITPPSSGSSGNRITYTFDASVEVVGGPIYDSGWSVYSGNIWEVAATSEVYDLHYDGTQGSKQANRNAPNSAGEWFWESNKLYLYAASNPATLYTSPGVEGTTNLRCIDTTNKSYLTLDGTGCDVRHGRRAGIYLGSNTSHATNITVKDFVVHDISYGIDGAAYCVRSNNVSNLIVQEVEAYGSGHNGMSFGKLSGNDYDLSSILVEKCSVHDNTHNGIDLYIIDGTATDVTCRYCSTYANESSGIKLKNQTADTSYFQNCYVYGNVTYGNGNCGISNTAPGGTQATGIDGLLIYNNTIYGNGIGGETPNFGPGIFDEGSSNSEIKNNILMNNAVDNGSNGREINIVNGDVDWVVNYNCVYNALSSNPYREDGTTYTHSGYVSYGQQANGFASDPEMTDPANDDFTLQSSSPCIGTGVNLGASYDDSLRPTATWVSSVLTADQDDYGDGWEVGAYVYTGEPVQMVISDTSHSHSTEPLNLTFTAAEPAGGAGGWKVQQIKTTVGTSGSTLSAPTDFDEVSSLTSAFILSGVNRRDSAGGSTDTVHCNDLGLTVRFTATDTIVCTRSGGTPVDTQNVSFFIVEYTGAASGAYEFLVRHRALISASASATASSVTIGTTPTDIDDCIPFYTIAGEDTSSGATNGCCALWCDGTDDLYYHRSGNYGTATSVSVEVVEFTGSAFSVGHGDSGETSSATGTITLNTDADGSSGSTFDVSSWANAFIWHTYKADSNDDTNQAIADTSAYYIPTSGQTTQVDWDHTTPTYGGATNRHFVHVLKCSDMTVTRYDDSAITEGESTVDVTSAGLTDLEQSFIVGSSRTVGTGVAYPMGWRMFYLNSLTEAAHYCAKAANTSQHRLQIVDTIGFLSTISLSVQGTIHENSVDNLTMTGHTPLTIAALESSHNLDSPSVTYAAVSEASVGIKEKAMETVLLLTK
jgi:hypothetical protein